MIRKSTFSYIFLTGLFLMLFLHADAQQCQGGLSVQIQGAKTLRPLEAQADAGHIQCEGSDEGMAQVEVEGGTPVYTYLWNNGGTGNNITNLTAGEYNVTVTDMNDCTTSANTEVLHLTPEMTVIADESSCNQCFIEDGGHTYFFNPQDEYIASVSDDELVEGMLGTTEVCVNILSEVDSCNGLPYLPRYWDVRVEEQTAGCMKFYFTQDELEALLDASDYTEMNNLVDNLVVTSYDGGADNCQSNINANVYEQGDKGLVFTPNDPVDGIWSASFCPSGYSTFYIHILEDEDQTKAVPLETVWLYGWHDNGINRLFWNTPLEINTKKFEVERSIDHGATYEYIGEVEAHGTTMNPHSYKFNDMNPAVDSNYYRLRVVDFDGSYVYSNIVILYSKPPDNCLKTYPNPFSEYLRIDFCDEPGGTAEIVMFEASGRKVYDKKHYLEDGNISVKIKLLGLPADRYWIRLRLPSDPETYRVIPVTKIIK